MAKRSCWAGEEYQEGHVICKRCPNKRSCRKAVMAKKDSKIR